MAERLSRGDIGFFREKKLLKTILWEKVARWMYVPVIWYITSVWTSLRNLSDLKRYVGNTKVVS
jgi:hypothetical protein